MEQSVNLDCKNDIQCPICLGFIEKEKNNITTSCGHSFCSICLFKHLKNQSTCPSCRSFIFNYDKSNHLTSNQIIDISNMVLEDSLSDILNIKNLIHLSVKKTLESKCDCINKECNKAMNLKEQEIEFLSSKIDDIFSKELFNIYFIRIIKPYLINVSIKTSKITEDRLND